MRVDPAVQRALYWIVPIGVAALIVVAELDAGGLAHRAPPPETPQPPAPVSVGLLPEYAIPGGPAALSATSEHTLFNPTRRPAPPAVASGGSSAPSQMKKNQFVLTGTAIDGNTAVAYLRENAPGGKSRVVKKGDKVNGMTVAEVTSDGIRFTQGGESEEVALKVAAGPRATVQPVTAPPPGVPGGGAAPGGRNAPGARNAPGGNNQQTLAERRRAARDAERAQGSRGGGRRDGAQEGATPEGNAGGAPAGSAGATQNSQWQQMYQRSRNRGGAQPQ
jgi:hypothetical protein